MSPKTAAEFGRQWPALQQRLRGFLRSRGVPTSEIDDLVQEVATRLVSFWPKIDNDRPIWPLTATIALNLVRDRGRRTEAELLGELPERAGHIDVADAGIARLELEAVIRAMKSLTPSQRAALLHAIHPEGEAPSTPAEKMLRMRARRRLANAVGRACGGFAFKMRRAADNLQGFFAKAEGVTQALACTTCLLVASAGSVTFDTALVEPGAVGDVRRSAVAGAGTTKILVMTPGGRPVSEDLKPTHAIVASDAASRDASSRSSSAKSKRPPSATNESVKTHSTDLTLADAPSLPNGDAPIPAPEPPSAPDNPVEPPTVDPPSPQPPTQAPQGGDAPAGVVEEVTELLKNAPR